MAKGKETILKDASGNERVTNQGNPMRLSVDFSAAALEARREWQDAFKVLNARRLRDTQQGYRSELTGREFPRQAKTKGVHHH